MVAALGLRQLSLAKRALRQNSELAKLSALRESYRLAVQQCDRFGHEIIPMINECNNRLKDLGVYDLLRSFNVEVSEESVTVTPPSPDVKDLMGRLFTADVIKPALHLHNVLDGFAHMFTSGVAAEEVAFSNVGTSFCVTVRTHAPLIIPPINAAGKEFPGCESPTLQLFQVWQSRFDRQRLLKEQQNLREKMTKIQQVRIPPMGT